jgi:hypothetical protein
MMLDLTHAIQLQEPHIRAAGCKQCLYPVADSNYRRRRSPRCGGLAAWFESLLTTKRLLLLLLLLL